MTKDSWSFGASESEISWRLAESPKRREKRAIDK